MIMSLFNTLRHFPDNIFKCIFSNKNVWIYIKFSLNFVPKGSDANTLALVTNKGLAPKRWEVINETNDDLFYWHIHA